MDDFLPELLSSLGITANYQGYFLIIDAVTLTVEEPYRLSAVTKELYPMVAAQSGSTETRVEHSLRRMAGLAWRYNPQLLQTIAGYPLSVRPSASRFIAILTAYCRRQLPKETLYGQLCMW